MCITDYSFCDDAPHASSHAIICRDEHEGLGGIHACQVTNETYLQIITLRVRNKHGANI